jgi:hypothetical protein
MTQITQFDKNNIASVRDEIQKALNAVAEKYGLGGIRLGNIKFDATEFSSSLTAKVNPATSEAAQDKYTKFSGFLGYDRNVVGEIYTDRGQRYKITDINPNRPKFPIVMEELTSGKTYQGGAKLPKNFDNKAIIYDASKNLFLY